MFKLPQTDLTAKSDAALRTLFLRATRDQATAPRASAAFVAASVALRLIGDELARRGFTPR